MLSSLFPVLYGAVAIALLWQAFRIMSRGFVIDKGPRPALNKNKLDKNEDRTGRLTIHPELLDSDGRITDEELLTVRFTGDIDPPQSAETSAE